LCQGLFFFLYIQEVDMLPTILGNLSRVLMVLMIFCFSQLSLAGVAIDDHELRQNLSSLTAKSFKQKAKAVEDIALLKDERLVTVFKTMLEGELYYRKADKVLVKASKTEEGYQLSDIVTGEDYGLVKKRKIKKVSVNNRLRAQLRSAIASIELASNNDEKRLGAAKDLVNNMSEELLPIIQLAIQTEDNEEIRSLLFLARGIVDIESDDEAVRLKALDVFEDQLAPEVIGILNRLLVVADDGSFAEESDAVRNKAARILKEANHQITFYKFVENLFFGISLGSVLLLAAVGLAITFGVMGVINMAHGEMIMLGAYTTYVVQQLMPDSIGTSLLISIPLAFLVSGLVGVVIERSVIRHLYGRPLETLLATFGISLILQQAVRSIFSPLNRQVESPDWMSGFLEINGALSLTYNRLYIIIFSLLVLAALAFLLKKTFIGLQMRAVTQNRAMASSMGIRSGWVDALTFGLGSGIAGIAGVALSQLTNVGPNLGQAYIVDSFMVVVFGGVGNIMGTFFAAMSLGIANKFLEPWAGAVMAKILVLIFIILFIQKRPRGMFALKGRSVEG
jgi:urea transport system permease protein